MTDLKGYALIIHEATGRTAATDLGVIEDCMRHTIFHSTLDWQTRAQLHAGAVDAVWVLLALGQLEPATDEERAMTPRLRALAEAQLSDVRA